jgi:hypothetical protein
MTPESAPRARVQNPLAAEVRSFRPGPGARPPRHNVLYIRNDPGPQNDAIVRALQRYFDTRPRRQPTADPRDEASVARHPQGLLEAGARWAQDMFYDFTDNGAANYQVRPDYRLWSGTLELKLNGPGLTTVSAPAAEASAAADNFYYYDPVNAAQEAQARTNELLSPPPADPFLKASWTGPPLMADNPYFAPAFAGQNTQNKINELLAAPPADPFLKASWVGPPLMADNPYFDSAFAGQNAVTKMRADISPDGSPGILVGPPNMADNPYFDSANASRNAMHKMRADLHPGQTGFPVGPPNMTDNPYFNSASAFLNAMHKMRADLAGGDPAALSPNQIQAGLAWAQQIRDDFFRPGPVLRDSRY